ncbi:MAG: DUF3108 domain-containing protein [Gemmatimonadota bacterium]|nr:DUF3108 domain-containing protein [Gemmatimonadota bacterium]
MMRSLMAMIILASAVSLAAPAPAAAQSDTAIGLKSVPFGIGEVCVYDVYFGPIRAGTGRMEVVDIQELRGKQAYHMVFTVKGGTFFYRVDDRYEIWVDTSTLSSLRYVQNIREGGYHRNTTYDMYPERAVYTENGGEEQPSVSNPLDDGSFVYFIRTVPLKVGEKHEFQRYFKPDRNPVILTATRKERIDVPVGKFDALVIHPTIKAKGLFAADGNAEVFLTDDARRIMLAMKTKLSFGSLNLYLKSYLPPKTPPAPATK